jgi:hypothetical protein
MGENGKKFLVENLTYDVLADKYLGIIDALYTRDNPTGKDIHQTTLQSENSAL